MLDSSTIYTVHIRSVSKDGTLKGKHLLKLSWLDAVESDSSNNAQMSAVIFALLTR